MIGDMGGYPTALATANRPLRAQGGDTPLLLLTWALDGQSDQKLLRKLRKPAPSMRYEPTREQREEITEAIRKQRFYGEIAGRREVQDEEYRHPSR